MIFGADASNGPVSTEQVNVPVEGEAQAPELINEEVKISTQLSAKDLKEIADGFYKKQDFKQAMNSYTQAIAADPEQASYYGDRAAALMALAKYNDALKDCYTAIKIRPGFTKIILRAVRCQILLGQLEEADSLLNSESIDGRAVLDEKRKIARLKESLELVPRKIEEGAVAMGLQLLRKLRDEMPGSITLSRLHIETLISCKKNDEALKEADRMLGEYRQDAKLLALRASALYMLGNVDRALSTLQEALRMDPDNSKTLIMYKKVKRSKQLKASGNDAFTKGKCEEACDLYMEAIENAPENDALNAVLFCNRAAALMKLGRYKEAADCCTKTIEIDSTSVKAHVRRGSCRNELEDFEGSVRDFDAALKFNPDDKEIRKLLRDATSALKKSKKKDYYKILGVDKDADERDIKKAYRRMALKHHPDKARGTPEEVAEAEQQFKDIAEAYTVLSDPVKKQRFDRGLDVETGMPDRDDMNMGGMGGMSQEEVFSMFFGGGGGAGFNVGGHGHGGHSFHFG